MMKRLAAAAAAALLLAAPALAQERPAPPPGFGASAGLSAQDAMRAAFHMGFGVGQEVHAELMRAQARIAELERLCGEPCKPKTPEQPK